MTSDAQLAANKLNAAPATGPKTPAGKSRSSKNALTFGLFHVRLRPRRRNRRLHQNCTSLWDEEDIAGIALLDPMQDPETEKTQRSVDRARAQSHGIFHRWQSARAKEIPRGRRNRRESRGRHAASQGLKIATPKPAKSLTLRVTTVRSCSMAVAAIMPSGALRGRPASWR